MDTKIINPVSFPFTKPNSGWRLRVSNKNFDRACGWSGLICVLFFYIFFFASSNVPPVKPWLSAEETADHYRRHNTGYKVGAAFIIFSGAFYGSFTAAMSTQMSRIPNVGHTVIATQLCSGAWACLTYTVPGLCFATAAYRLSRPPEITQALNDLSWIMAIMPFPPFIVQNWAFAFAIFSDNRPIKLYPHFVGWVNVVSPWTFAFSLGLHCTFSGVFAWNGALTFWLAGIVFAIQFFINIIFTLRAIEKEIDAEDVPINIV